jgi:hypothetical protein
MHLFKTKADFNRFLQLQFYFSVSRIRKSDSTFVKIRLKTPFMKQFILNHKSNFESHFHTSFWRSTDKSFVDKKVVFHESPENFYAALESKKGGVSDNWGVGLGEYFVKRG